MSSGGATVTAIGRLDGEVVCLAANPSRRRVAAWAFNQDVALLAERRPGEWKRDERGTAFLRSMLREFVREAAIVFAGARFIGERLFLTLDTVWELRGGTLCVLEPKAGRQWNVHQFPRFITALKPGFETDSFFAGLDSGELFHVRLPPP